MKFKILLAATAALVLASCNFSASNGDDADDGAAMAAAPVGLTREAVNPWSWGGNYGFNQGETVSGATRTLYIAGQTSVDENGEAIHAGDPRAQLETAFANLDTVLEAAGMDRSNVVRLNVYTTNIGAMVENWDIYMSRYAEQGYTPPVTAIGVAGLFEPELMVEIEAVAVE